MADRPWKVPSNDGEVLLWPDAPRWGELAVEHHVRMARRPDDGPRLLGVPLAELRRSARAALPTFVGPTADPDAPWVVTGHQTVPLHPGVWAKLVATEAAARRLGGAAVHVHVDHDVPSGGRLLTWPARGPDGRPVRRGALALDDREPFEGDDPAPPVRRSINAAITGELNARLGLRVTDAFCGFKAYRVATLARLSLSEPGYAFPMQLWVHAAVSGARVAELPVRRIYRDLSRSFGEALDDPMLRLAHYRDVLHAEIRRHAAALDAGASHDLAPTL